MFFTTGSFTLFLLLPALATAGPWCFKCDDVFHPAACQEVIACGDYDMCYTDKHTSNNGADVYSSGCKPAADCTTRVRRATATCDECCNSTLCNEVLCQAPPAGDPKRLWCADCQAQQDPSDCDQVTLCSLDERCSVKESSFFGRTMYNMGCEKETVCQGKTLGTDKMQCCDSHLCNTNKALVSPDLYTPPPPTTTTPPPAAPTANIPNTTVDYVSMSQPNETIQLVCNIDGFPVPNVTWIFTPDSASASGNSSAVAAPTGNASGAGNTTASTNSTGNATSGNATSAGNGTSAANATSAPTSMEITSGVTTTGNVSILEITAPEDSDSGVYTCRVENSLGSSESNSTVTVQRAPVIAGPPNETVTGNARDDIILDCDVDGSDPLTVTWLHPPDAGGIEELANGSLLIHNAHGDNNGDYLCLAQNAVGNAGKTFTLDINDSNAVTCPTPPSTSVTPLTSPLTTTLTTTPLSTTTTTLATTPTTTTPATTPTTTTAATTTQTSGSTTPCVCPTTPTTLAATTVLTTIPTTTPTTLLTTTPTTTTTTTTTTATTTTPTTTPTTPAATTTAANTGPYALSEVMHNVEDGMTMLQCGTDGPSHGTTYTWSRMVQDFDHTNKQVFHDTSHGVLSVTPPPHSMLEAGIYECRVDGAPPDETARFVVYKEIPLPIDCQTDFAFGSHPSLGIVFRAECPGTCQTAPHLSPPLHHSDIICENAIDRGLIPQSGGQVYWLIDANNEVSFVKEENKVVTLIK